METVEEARQAEAGPTGWSMWDSTGWMSFLGLLKTEANFEADE